MAWVYDPESGEYYDDDQYFTEQQHGGSQAAFMPNSNSFLNVPADYNKYGMEPYEAADANAQLLTVDKVTKLMSNPAFLQLVAGQTGADTYDFGQIAGEIPYFQGGVGTGGGGGAGYGGGSGYGQQAVYTTKWSDAAANSQDPYEQGIYQAIMGGQSPVSVINGLADPNRADPITDPDELDRYNAMANAIFEEQDGARRAAMQPQGLTPQQEWSLKTGQPDPSRLYGADDLPADVDLSGLTSMLKGLRSQGRDAAAQGRTLANAAPHEPNNRFLLFDQDQADGGTGNPLFRPSAPTPTNAGRAATAALSVGRPIGRGSGFVPPPAANGAEPKQMATRRNGFDIFGQGGGLANQQARQAKRDEATAAKNRSKRIKKNADTIDVGVRQLAANDLARQGRTPLRESQNAQLKFLRDMGIGI